MRFSSLLAPVPGLEPGVHSHAAARPRAAAPATGAQAEPLAATETLDRRTAWPLHRIRWFLVSQDTVVRGRRPR
jgi:hypothetical protein